MPVVTWLRALSALGAMVEATTAFRERRVSSSAPSVPSATLEPTNALETRLANVVVAALREAFDRDRARFDLERDVHEGAQARHERAVRLEWLRQTGAHVLGQTRHLAVLAVAVWLASIAAAVWLGELSWLPKVLLGLGWLAFVATIALAFVTHQRVTDWLAHSALQTASTGDDAGVPGSHGQIAMPWLFVAGVCLTGASFLTQL